MLGRIALIKAYLLPKFLFLFQNIPLQPDIKKIKIWQKNLEKFIAGTGKKIRFIKNVKYGQSVKGGLGIPQLEKYYEAFQINQITRFIQKEESPEWLEMEDEGEAGIVNNYIYNKKGLKRRTNTEPFHF